MFNLRYTKQLDVYKDRNYHGIDNYLKTKGHDHVVYYYFNFETLHCPVMFLYFSIICS